MHARIKVIISCISEAFHGILMEYGQSTCNVKSVIKFQKKKKTKKSLKKKTECNSHRKKNWVIEKRTE